MTESIGQRLKQYRALTGLTQEQIAEQLGIPHNTYVRYENDIRRPTTENALKLSLYYHISMNQLLYGANKNADSETDPMHITDADLKFALWGGDAKQITDAQLEEVKQFAQFIKKRGPLK